MVALVLADAVVDRFGGDAVVDLERAVRRVARRRPLAFSRSMIRPILRYGEQPLHQAAADSDSIRRRSAQAHRRHDRDHVRGAGHRPGGARRSASRCASSSSTSRVGRETDALIAMVNPSFVERDGMQLEDEGCLSVPGFNATVVRPARAVDTRPGSARPRTDDRGQGAARAGVPARDGSSRRRGVRRSPARHQARPDRPADSEAAAIREMVSSTSLRIVYFGTPEFAVPTLRRLLDAGENVVALVSQPDRPRGRGHRLAPTPTKELALERGVPVLQPERLKDPQFLESVSALQPDLGVVAAYGKLLPDDLLRIPRLGMINVHASLLPRWRGAAPIHRAVIAGDRETGITIMRVVKELDAGAMFAVVKRPHRPGRDERRGRTRSRGGGRRSAARRRPTRSLRDARSRRRRTLRTSPTRRRSPRAKAPSTGRFPPRGCTTSLEDCSPGLSSRRASVRHACSSTRRP